MSCQLELVGLPAQDFQRYAEAFTAALELVLTALSDDATVQTVRVVDASVIEESRRRLEEDEEVVSSRVRVQFSVAVATTMSADTLRQTFADTLSDAVSDGTLERAMQTQSALLSGATVDVEVSLALVATSTTIVEMDAPVAAPTTLERVDPTDASGGASGGGDEDNDVSISIMIVLVLVVLMALCFGLMSRLRHRAILRKNWFKPHRARQAPPTDVDSAPAFELLIDNHHSIGVEDGPSLVLSKVLEEERLLLAGKSARGSREPRSKEGRHFDWETMSVRWVSKQVERLYVRRFSERLVLVPIGDSEPLEALGGRPVAPSDGDGSIFSEALRGALDRSGNNNESFVERAAAFREQSGSLRVPWTAGKVKFSVRRQAVAADAYARLRDVAAEHWRRPFFISFSGEPALDAGGSSREFFHLLSSELFDVSYGLMKYGAGYAYHLANDADSAVAFPTPEDRRARYTFVGRILGKALLEGHLLPTAHSSLVLLKHVCCEPLGLTDLQYLDYDLWRSLDVLRGMPLDDVEHLALTFSVQHDVLGELVERELKPGGAGIAVTGGNVDEFLRLRLQERAMDVCREGLAAFLQGLYDVVPMQYLMLLSARELELQLCGVPELPLDDWRSTTVYKGAFEAEGTSHLLGDPHLFPHQVPSTPSYDGSGRFSRLGTTPSAQNCSSGPPAPVASRPRASSTSRAATVTSASLPSRPSASTRPSTRGAIRESHFFFSSFTVFSAASTASTFRSTRPKRTCKRASTSCSCPASPTLSPWTSTLSGSFFLENRTRSSMRILVTYKKSTK